MLAERGITLFQYTSSIVKKNARINDFRRKIDAYEFSLEKVNHDLKKILEEKQIIEQRIQHLEQGTSGNISDQQILCRYQHQLSQINAFLARSKVQENIDYYQDEIKSMQDQLVIELSNRRLSNLAVFGFMPFLDFSSFADSILQLFM